MNRHLVTRRKTLAMLGGSALAAALPVSVRAQGRAPLTLGIQTSTWGAPGMVAEAEKLFEKAGANVTVHKFDSGRAVRDEIGRAHV